MNGWLGKFVYTSDYSTGIRIVLKYIGHYFGCIAGNSL